MIDLAIPGGTWLNRVILVLAVLAVCLPAGGCSDDDPVSPSPGPDLEVTWPEARSLWSRSAAPHHGLDPEYVAATGDARQFAPAARVETRWFLPHDPVYRRYLEPHAEGDVRAQIEPTLELYLRAEDGVWEACSWGGITRGLGVKGISLDPWVHLEVWVNDFTVDPQMRRGRLHFDFGFLDEDFAWPQDGTGEMITGTYQDEDADGDGVFTYLEDLGLDGIPSSSDLYGVEYGSGADPFPYINGTEHNQIHDHEDLDGDGAFETFEACFTLAVDLSDTPAFVDVLADYPTSETGELADLGQTWRGFRLPLASARVVSSPPEMRAPDPDHVTHLRIWYEDQSAGGGAARRLQLARMAFTAEEP